MLLAGQSALGEFYPQAILGEGQVFHLESSLHFRLHRRVGGAGATLLRQIQEFLSDVLLLAYEQIIKRNVDPGLPVKGGAESGLLNDISADRSCQIRPK